MPKLRGIINKVKSHLTKRKLTSKAIDTATEKHFRDLAQNPDYNKLTVNELKQKARKNALKELTEKGYYL
jgi:hypothetical protein